VNGVYYNDSDPYAAQWLRNLIAAGHIPCGDVDERDIRDVRPSEIRGYQQHHFFAGIGGWPLALQIAGWPDGRPVCTGSPPCQDFSLAGAVWGVRAGIDGDRGSLVGTWLDIVAELQPGQIYFENVPGIKPALAKIKECLEGIGYSVAESQRATADVAGPHLRKRVFIAAHRDGQGWQEPRQQQPQALESDPRRTAPGDIWVASASRACGLDDGFPRRVDAVRAYGNAVDPWVAASVIAGRPMTRFRLKTATDGKLG